MGLEFYDDKLGDIVETGLKAIVFQLEGIKEAIMEAKKGTMQPTLEADELVKAIINIQKSIDDQTAVVAASNDLNRNMDEYPTVEDKDASDVATYYALFNARVEDDGLNDGNNNLSYFKEAFHNGKLADMKMIIDEMSFIELKAAFGVMEMALSEPIKYYEMDVVKFRLNVDVDDKSHFYKVSKKTKHGVVVKVDGFDIIGMLAQKLIIHVYNRSNIKYKDEVGDNLMAVGIRAKEDQDGDEAFDLAVKMLKLLSTGARFDKNEDVQNLFISKLETVSQHISDFMINKDNITLLSTIKSVGLNYTIKV